MFLRNQFCFFKIKNKKRERKGGIFGTANMIAHSRLEPSPLKEFLYSCVLTQPPKERDGQSLLVKRFHF